MQPVFFNDLASIQSMSNFWISQSTHLEADQSKVHT